jgi:hypothetical protein
MYKFAGYGLKDSNGDMVPQLFKNRGLVDGVRQQNGLPESAIVQLFTFEKLEYKEPIETKEDDGTA